MKFSIGETVAYEWQGNWEPCDILEYKKNNQGNKVLYVVQCNGRGDCGMAEIYEDDLRKIEYINDI